MRDIMYEYIPSENIAKVNINDFETLLKIKDNYEKLIKRIPNNILQQRIDKAIELIEQDYFEDGSGEYIEQVLSILRGEE